ncbi:MAG: hypothetical protein R3F21_19010 [Myxococcota bacterium]
MSVHGEYQRVLRIVQVRIAEAGGAIAARWSEPFERARIDELRDLSTAARTAIALVAELEAELEADLGLAPAAPGEARDDSATTSRFAPLRDACHSLRAHCRAILGQGEGTRPGD